MNFTWQSLIDRAKTYCDDDHSDQKSWITPARWLEIANVEYAQLYKRWIRSGLITPAITLDYMDGPTTAFTGVLALVGVAKDYGDFVRRLHPAQVAIGHDAFWRGSTAPEGASVRWAATGAGDVITVELDPVPNDLVHVAEVLDEDDEVVTPESGNYLVRYVPTVAYATNAATSIELPYGADERLVLGMARRAHLKDSGASALLNGLITEADAETNFHASSKVGGMRVKVKAKNHLVSTPRESVWPERHEWTYF